MDWPIAATVIAALLTLLGVSYPIIVSFFPRKVEVIPANGKSADRPSDKFGERVVKMETELRGVAVALTGHVADDATAFREQRADTQELRKEMHEGFQQVNTKIDGLTTNVLKAMGK